MAARKTQSQTIEKPKAKSDRVFSFNRRALTFPVMRLETFVLACLPAWHKPERTYGIRGNRITIHGGLGDYLELDDSLAWEYVDFIDENTGWHMHGYYIGTKESLAELRRMIARLVRIRERKGPFAPELNELEIKIDDAINANDRYATIVG